MIAAAEDSFGEALSGTAGSLRRLATIDDQGVSSDEGGRIRTEPENRRGNLFRLTHPPDRLLRDHPIPPLLGAPAEAVHNWRFDNARTYGVHADV
jgi:hypothetical protein